jgi:Ca2+-binding EF-hand superfamily protein
MDLIEKVSRMSTPLGKAGSILLAMMLILPLVMRDSSMAASEDARIRRVKLAFRILDVNGDQTVTPEEFLWKQVDAFAAPDRHMDSFLTADEVIITPEQFLAVDRNKDGKVTYVEFIDSRYGQFDAYDHDGNHLLDLQEFVRILVVN